MWKGRPSGYSRANWLPEPMERECVVGNPLANGGMGSRINWFTWPIGDWRSSLGLGGVDRTNWLPWPMGRGRGPDKLASLANGGLGVWPGGVQYKLASSTKQESVEYTCLGNTNQN